MRLNGLRTLSGRKLVTFVMRAAAGRGSRGFGLIVRGSMPKMFARMVEGVVKMEME